VIYLLGLAAACLLGAGFVLQQRAAERAPKGDYLRLRLLADLLRDRSWLAGVATMVAGQLLGAWVFGHLVLAVAEPLLASYVLFALLLAWPLARQPLSVSEIAGALILVAGVTALSVARAEAPASAVSVGSAANWPYAAGVAALVAAAFAAAGRRHGGNRRALLTGVSAGVAFGMQDAITRLVVRTLTGHGMTALLVSWPVYALVVVGLAALWLMESSFNAGPLYASLPPMAAGEPVTGIVVGLVVFGDRLSVTPGFLALQAGGIVSLVLGVVLVGRGPSLAAACRSRPGRPGGQEGKRARSASTGGACVAGRRAPGQRGLQDQYRRAGQAEAGGGQVRDREGREWRAGGGRCGTRGQQDGGDLAADSAGEAPDGAVQRGRGRGDVAVNALGGDLAAALQGGACAGAEHGEGGSGLRDAGAVGAEPDQRASRQDEPGDEDNAGTGAPADQAGQRTADSLGQRERQHQQPDLRGGPADAVMRALRAGRDEGRH
jgi:hypothetical protein